MKIIEMKTNRITNPIGFDFEDINLSWKVDGVGLTQKHTNVIISTDDKFNEIVFESEKDACINGACYSPDIELSPKTRYYWKVVTTAQNDEKAEGMAFFETGKINQEWGAHWIGAPFEGSPYICKSFKLGSNFQNAKAYVTSRGLYELYCNGQKVGDDYLDPGYNSYDLWEQTHTYDIGKYLKTGENVIGFIMGDGWYKGRLGCKGGKRCMYGENLMILAEIEIDNAIFGTDETWNCKKSPIVETSIYDGEIYDARLEDVEWCIAPQMHGWNKVKIYNESKDKIQDRLRLPTKKHEVFSPNIIISPKNEIILDFGQNIAGWVEGDILLSEGEELKIEHGEILQDGCFYNKNLRSAIAQYKFISNGKKAHFRPYFTFYGFRYAKITGCTDNAVLKNFRAYAVYSELQVTGSITTGHDLVNKLISNIMWGQKGNFLDIPTDCPQRDERLGWTGDTQIFAATASYNMDTYAFYKKYMKDLIEEQKLLNGGIPLVIPHLRKKTGFITSTHHSSCAWGDVATVLPWVLYEYFGDKKLLLKHYEAMTAWVLYIKKQDDESGGARLWQTGFHFADWLALDNFRDPSSPMGGTDEYFVASAWYAYSALLTSKAAKALGKKNDTAFYFNLYKDICAAIKCEYFTATGRCAIATQTAKVLALKFGLVDGAVRERTAKDLVKQLRKNDMKLETGFCGTPYLCTVLSDMGYIEDAYALFLREELPGWLYEVVMGATTVWERWDSVMPDGTMNPKGMNSLNHYAYGAVKEWLYKDVCGISLNNESVAFKNVVLKPNPNVILKYAKCIFNSPCGKYEINWEITGQKVKYYIEIPFDCTALVKLPKQNMKELNSGRYEFENEL